MQKSVLTYNNMLISFERLQAMLTVERLETFKYCGDVFIKYKSEAVDSYMDIVDGNDMGYYLHYINNNEELERLSLGNSERLTETVEYDVDCYASAGLFIPINIALKEIEFFCKTGNITNNIKWISPNEVPEEGNW